MTRQLPRCRVLPHVDNLLLTFSAVLLYLNQDLVSDLYIVSGSPEQKLSASCSALFDIIGSRNQDWKRDISDR